jgi:hypothetical protein
MSVVRQIMAESAWLGKTAYITKGAKRKKNGLLSYNLLLGHSSSDLRISRQAPTQKDSTTSR